MNAPRHAWIALLAIGSAFAQDQPPGGDAPKNRPGKDRPGRMIEMWKRADTDSDGFISIAEFAAMERPGRLPEEKRAEIFKRIDKNGDGKIGPEEMPKRREGGGMPPLQQVDADKDGRIVFEEFQKLDFVAKLPEERQRGLFKGMDKDGDGALTSKDRPAKDRPRGDGPPRDGKDGRRDGRGGRAPNPLELIKHLDQNGDGALSFEEFRQAGFLKGKTEDEQEDRFEDMDRNKDLKLDAADFPPPGDRPAEGGEPPKKD